MTLIVCGLNNQYTILSENKYRCGMSLQQIFSVNIKKHRKLQNISQEKLAELSELHRTYISDIECCRRNISLTNIEKIANALNIHPYLLLKDGDNND